MRNTDLNEREKFILGTIVEDFILNAAPVGSRYLTEKHDIALSSATIRNVMMDLEAKGYVEQPHTSAGRIPTDKGYRMYVDSLMQIENLSQAQKHRILMGLTGVSRDIEYILEAASFTLAKISNQLGVVLAPKFYRGVFERIELFPLADRKILAVISIRSGLVKTITLEIDKDISRESLEEIASIISERLHGLTLEELKASIDDRLRDLQFADIAFIDMVIESSHTLFNRLPASELHITGTKNIMAQPEFAGGQTLQQLLGLLDDKSMLLHVFDSEDKNLPDTVADTAREIRITIGEENRDELVRHCSIITATYHLGNISGTLGVLGPTRMQYSKMVALVGYMAKTLSKVLTPGMG